jgi:hypothetical protein
MKFSFDVGGGLLLNAIFNNISVIYIVAVSFIGGGNQSTRRKPQTCRKSLTNFILKCAISINVVIFVKILI